MSGFLYFVDGWVNPITMERIAEFGLGYAFERMPQWGKIGGRTPSGGDGTLLCDEARLGERSMAFLPDVQTWRKLPKPKESERPDVYVGFFNDAKPGPDSLAREKQLAGEYVTLADGNEWLVPRLRFFAGDMGFHVALPVLFDVDDDGELVIDGVSEEYNELNAIGQRLVEAMVDGELGNAPRLTLEESITVTATLLRRNYAVTVAELGKKMLAALANDASLMAVCKAAIEYDKALEWAEKKSDAESAG